MSQALAGFGHGVPPDAATRQQLAAVPGWVHPEEVAGEQPDRPMAAMVAFPASWTGNALRGRDRRPGRS